MRRSGVETAIDAIDFDVFLSHSHSDHASVRIIAERLRDDFGLRPFLDRWHLVPGDRWQPELERGIQRSGAAAVFFGAGGLAPWHHEEVQVALNRAASADGDFRVIPVLLPKADEQHLPAFLRNRTWVQFASGPDDDEAMRRLAAAIRGEAIDDDRYELPDEPTPYRGLYAFDIGDAEMFFGRIAETDRLVDAMRSRRFVAVVGPSGSGKSSLVRAGLLPKLGNGAIPGSDRWRVLVCRPGDDPFRAVARTAADGVPPTDRLRLIDDLVRRFSTSDSGLGTTLTDLHDHGRPVVLVVDQFEELFTLCQRPDPECRDVAARFVQSLARAAEGTSQRVFVVITLRADFLGSALQIRSMARLLDDPVLVGPLSDSGLREVIVGPAGHVGAFLEKGLVAAILRDMHDQHGALPLLQHALLELWRQRRGPWLTLDAYEEIGRVGGALAHRAEAVFASLTSGQQALARLVMLRLTALGDGVADTRRRAERSELYPADVDPRDVDTVLQALSSDEARLMVAGEDAVEIAHEALLHEWERLRRWLGESRDDLRTHRRLTRAAADWDGPLDRDPGALYRGAPLAQAEEWAAANPNTLNDTEQLFLETSRKALTDEVRRLRSRLYAAVVALVVALAAVGVALNAFDNANRESERANQEAERATAEALRAVTEAERADAQAARALASGLALRAEAIKVENPAMALMTAVASTMATPSPTRESLGALVGARVAFAQRAGQQMGEPLQGHAGRVWGVAFSPDGTLLASAGDDGTVRLWDPGTGEPIGEPLQGHTSGVNGVAFSPDGTMLASAGDDGTVRLWDPGTGEPIGEPLQGHTGGVNGVAFSPDGTMLASAGDDGTVRLWDPGTGEPIGEPLQGHAFVVNGVAFSPDGTMLASAGNDRTVRLWDPGTGEPIGEPLQGHTSGVNGVAFSPDGTMLASAGFDRTVRLWDTGTGEPIGEPLQGHTDWVRGVAFSPDGTLLASAGFDGTVRLWDPGTGEPIGEPLQGHTGRVWGVAFSPDGTMLASAGDDGTVRLWDPGTGEPIGEPLQGHTSGVNGVAFSPDGTMLASAGFDGTVRLWDPGTGEPIGEPLQGHTSGVNGVAFSPDGTMLASAGFAGTVRLWDPGTGEPIGEPLQGHPSGVNGVAFSPDGTLLASAGDDGTVRLWDPGTGEPIGEPLQGHTGGVYGVAFSPDGTMLASAGFAGTVRLWDPGTGEPIGEPLQGHPSGVNGVAFSPDGTMLASAGFDGTVRLWDPGTGEPIGEPLQGHTGRVWGVAFSSDGTLLASAGFDGTVRLWDPGTGEPIGEPLQGHTDWVRGVAFSSDGTLLASAGVDRTVRLWDVMRASRACELAAPYLDDEQVDAAFPPGVDAPACSRN